MIYQRTGEFQLGDTIKQLAENKLIILYLVEKMGIAISNSEICQFSLEKNYMDYFSVQQYLAELVEAAWLDKNRENNSTRYTLTDAGEEVIQYFISHISEKAKSEISDYVSENRKRIQAEYEVTANYFLELNNDYLVKCCLSDVDGSNLMAVSVSVATKQQAQQICSHWKQNVTNLYGSIFAVLVSGTQNAAPAKAKAENFPLPTTDTENRNI